MGRTPNTFLLLLLALVLNSCGADSDAGMAGGLDVSFFIFKGGTDVPCRDVPEIEIITVTMLTESGAALAGYPREIECNAGGFYGSFVDRRLTIEVEARGRLGSDSNAILFAARSEVTPSTPSLVLSLKPEVAYLTVGWNFGAGNLAPCGNAVSYVDVLISAATTQRRAYFATLGCIETPQIILEPIASQEYVIKVEAYSEEGVPLYNNTETRLLARGDNEHTAVLAPLGGLLKLDWQFVLPGMQPIRSCDDQLVAVTEVVANVHSREGGDSITETIACTEGRPYSFRFARFSQNRELTLDLVAEGTRRFRQVVDFTMPSGDWESGALNLVPVGTASVSVQVSTSTCSEPTVDNYEVDVISVPGGTEPEELVREISIQSPKMEEVVEDLPYGDYRVEIEQRAGAQVFCTTSGSRSITDRTNDWLPFIF